MLERRENCLNNHTDLTKGLDLHTLYTQFDLYLDGPPSRPVGVAVSGGGDSVALLRLLLAWGKRPLEVFHVDHGLNCLSVTWCAFVKDLCQNYGVPFHDLCWLGAKPQTGLSAKARAARLELIFQAARTQNVGVVCFGHTRDDVLEAHAMRTLGSSVTAPQLWSPAALWPQGRGIFCFRPLLALSREELRGYLRTSGQDWIEDPSNTSGVSLRSQVRLSPTQALWEEDTRPSLKAGTFEALFEDAQNLSQWGYFRLHRAHLASLDIETQLWVLGVVIVCAGGGDHLPRKQQVRTVIQTPAPMTLCGAKIWSDENLIHICRNVHDRRRVAWCGDIIDGRFSIDCAVPIIPLYGHSKQLVKAHQALLREYPAAVRASLPVWEIKFTQKVGLAHKPLREFGYKESLVVFWAQWRVRSALGQMPSEAAIAPRTNQEG